MVNRCREIEKTFENKHEAQEIAFQDKKWKIRENNYNSK